MGWEKKESKFMDKIIWEKDKFYVGVKKSQRQENIDFGDGEKNCEIFVIEIEQNDGSIKDMELTTTSQYLKNNLTKVADGTKIRLGCFNQGSRKLWSLDVWKKEE